MGGIYARRERHPDAVWKAIYDQYRPASGSDDPPREASGAILSLADRFDSLCSLFRIGLVPTGSQDPYGLRRAALGAVSIAIARNWRTDWRPIARKALSLLPPDLPGPGPEETLEELGRFFAERLRAICSSGAATATTRSPRSLNVGVWDFADAADRARALSEARRHMDFRSLILAFKRIRNIVGSDSRGRARPEAVPRGRRARPRRRLPAGEAGDRGVRRRAPLPRGDGDDRLDRSVARPFLRRRPGQLPGRGSEAQPAGAARFHPEGVHEPRRLFRNRGGEMKRVFSFGNGVAEGAGLGKETLGGKGAGLAEMTALGIPVPPGFTIETSVCADVSRGASLDGIRAEVESALAAARARRRQAVRRPRESAARLGPLRRALVDARHDGHDPEPGPDVADRPGPRRALGRAVRPRLPAAVPRDVRRRRAPRSAPRVREGDAGGQARARRPVRHGPLRGGPRRDRAARRADRAAADRPRLSGRSARAALGRDRGGLPLLGQRAREDLPQAPPHPRRLGHRGQRPGDGLRQPRRDVRDRASRSRATRPRARRSSTASSCRTRRARTSSRASARRGR